MKLQLSLLLVLIAVSTVRSDPVKLAQAVLEVGVDKALEQLDKIWTGDVIRSVKWAIENHSGKTMVAIGSESNSGSLATYMNDIPNDKTGLLVWEKPRGSATGAIGVLYYKIGDKIISLMASVPYDFNLYSNWCNVAVSKREEKYYDLYKGKNGCAYPTKAGRWGYVKDYEIKFWLTDKGKAHMKVVIGKKGFF